MAARDLFESLAARWDDAGRPDSMLVDGYDLIALRSWTFSRGAAVDGMSELLQAFVRASEKAQPEDWLDAYLSERETCRRCGESYRLENIMLCTQCDRTYCHKCMADEHRAANGNIACVCGGELVG